MTQPTPDQTFDRPLPASNDAEKMILGAALTDPKAALTILSTLESDDFHIEKHRRIFGRMEDLQQDGKAVDRMTVTEALSDAGQLQSVDGLSYIISLDDGMPEIYNLDSWCGIIREKANLRRLIVASQSVIDRAMMSGARASEITGFADAQLRQIADREPEDRGLKTLGEHLADEGYEAFLNAESMAASIPVPWYELVPYLGGGFLVG